MGTVAFDTLKLVETLTSGGVKEGEAKAIATACRDASGEQQLVTKSDLKTGLDEVRTELKTEIASVKHDLLKWIIGLALAQFAVLVGLTLKIH